MVITIVHFLHHFMTLNVPTQVKDKCISDPAYEEVNNAFERALVFMHKMPRVWMDYCTFLVSQRLITRCQRYKTFYGRILRIFVFVCR
jgi:hypothetical protein